MRASWVRPGAGVIVLVGGLSGAGLVPAPVDAAESRAVDVDPCARARELVARWQLGPSWGPAPSRAEVLVATERCPGEERARILATLSPAGAVATVSPTAPLAALPSPVRPVPAPSAPQPPNPAPEVEPLPTLPAPRSREAAGLMGVPAAGDAFAATHTQHFDFRWSEETRENWSHGDAQRLIGEYLEAAYAEVGQLLDSHPREPISVVFYDPETFEKRYGNASWAWGTWDGTAIRIRSSLKSAPTLRDELFHEYTHVLLSQLQGASRPPGWLEEGFAELVERRAELGEARGAEPLPREVRSVAAHARAGRIPPLSTRPIGVVSDGARCAKRRRNASRAYLAVVYLHEQAGMEGLVRIFRELGRGRAYPEAMRLVYPRGDAAFVSDFERWLQDRAH